MKKILIKVYRPTGEFLTIWRNVEFQGFTKEINRGLGECVIDLGEKFDYRDAGLVVGNTVDILIDDGERADGDSATRIYSGYISMYKPWVMGKREGIKVYLLGHYTKLDLDILKNGSQSTLYSSSTAGLTITAPGSAGDLGLILRAIIDRYRAETTNPKLNYTLASIPSVGVTVEYLFELKTYREALDKVIEMTPVGWFWYVNENGTVYLKQKPATPTHTFIFGRHFSGVQVERSIEMLRNAMFFWNGEVGGSSIFKLYQDTGSVNLYGRRAEKYFDWAISSETTSARIASKLMGESKDPQVKVICEIIDDNENPDKGYNIESIQPGDSCSFKGFDEQIANIFNENMLITKVVYYLNKVELTVEITKSNMVEWLSKVDKKMDSDSSSGIPVSYS